MNAPQHCPNRSDIAMGPTAAARGASHSVSNDQRRSGDQAFARRSLSSLGDKLGPIVNLPRPIPNAVTPARRSDASNAGSRLIRRVPFPCWEADSWLNLRIASDPQWSGLNRATPGHSCTVVTFASAWATDFRRSTWIWVTRIDRGVGNSLRSRQRCR